ncbi:bifunctional adenosine 5'-phosphosulfate phosphorylase/adenylylsulfatase HINT4 isoform X3 [Typha latifolia]|uniref:bifunctional adenosine 5'-phosphosulfate phosphorylase/adenylylsulfatase HINT4 isoform X3 n=1 Tax=Typha latifolia TaxID=4733 RepID=UPI003C2AB1BB
MRLLKSCLSSRRPGQQMANPCVFCQIAQGSTSTALLYADERVVAFPDIKPSAFRHYLVIPVEHISTVNELQGRVEHHQLVNHMLNVGKDLLKRDAPESELHRFGFHRPPFNSVNHLHLHCLALPFIPSWKCVKYTPMAFGGFQEAENLLEQIKPPSTLNS